MKNGAGWKRRLEGCCICSRQTDGENKQRRDQTQGKQRNNFRWMHFLVWVKPFKQMCQMFEAVHTSSIMHGSWDVRPALAGKACAVLCAQGCASVKWSYSKWQTLPSMHGLAVPAAWINIPSSLSLGTEPEPGLCSVLPTLSLSIPQRVEEAPWGQAQWVIPRGTQEWHIWLSSPSPGQVPQCAEWGVSCLRMGKKGKGTLSREFQSEFIRHQPEQ